MCKHSQQGLLSLAALEGFSKVRPTALELQGFHGLGRPTSSGSPRRTLQALCAIDVHAAIMRVESLALQPIQAAFLTLLKMGQLSC